MTAGPVRIPAYMVGDVATIAEARVMLSVPDTAVVVLDEGCTEAEWFGQWDDDASDLAKSLHGLIVAANSEPANVLEDHRTVEHAEQCMCPHGVAAHGVGVEARGCLVPGGCEYECGGYQGAGCAWCGDPRGSDHPDCPG